VNPFHRCSSYFFKILFNIIPHILDVKTVIYNQNICYRPAVEYCKMQRNRLVTINSNYHMRFEVHTAVTVKIAAFWCVTSCSLLDFSEGHCSTLKIYWLHSTVISLPV
jgi:hypothetical protein